MSANLKPEEIEQIKSLPWVKSMLDQLNTKMVNTVVSFSKIVLELSTSKRDIDAWVNVFRDQFSENCQELLLDMQHLHEDTLGKVETSLTKIQQLCKTLQIEMPNFGNEKLSLYQEQSRLKSYITEFEQMIESRTSELKKLLAQQEVLCKSLGRPVSVLVQFDPLPSKNEIKHLQEHIEELETEKFQRLENYTELSEEIIKMVRNLKYKPKNAFEEMICNVSVKDDVKEFCVSDENMLRLVTFRDELAFEFERINKEIDALRSSIEHYWNLLDIDMIERECFRKKMTGINYEVLDALIEERRRCEELKKANIKVFVERIRHDLQEIWTKCHCPESVKTSFGFFETDCYTEDLLDLHENELKRWYSYYEENKPLLVLLEKHKKLWEKMIQLEENATGSKRYNNRGGQLLKEEKERNKLAKSIPLIEAELIEHANAYEARHAEPFCSFGLTVEQYINSLHEERENIRRQKLSARKMQRDNTVLLTAGKSSVSVLPQACTPVPSASKRKLVTPLLEHQKKARVTPRLAATEPKKNSRNVPKIIISRLSTERRKRIEKVKRRSLLKKMQENSRNETYINNEYDDFENELSARKIDCRSTMIPVEEEMAPTPRHISAISKTPSRLTPKTTQRTPKTPTTPNGTNKLSRAKSALKLIF